MAGSRVGPSDGPNVVRGKIMTVTGPIVPHDLGFTLPHEHLIVQGWDHRERNYPNSIFMELEKFVAAGGRTIVDVSSLGMPRDPEFCLRLALRASIQVVLGSGYYKDAWLPTEAHGLTIDEMHAAIVSDILDGVLGSSARAGIIGEMGVSRKPTKTEERALAAAGRAQRATGAGVSLHLDIGSAPAEYDHALDILEREGADLERVAVGHLVARPDQFELCERLVLRGCLIEFDLFGQERRTFTKNLINTHPDVQVSSIKGFIDRGMLDHILLSQDVRHVELMTVNGGDGYAHLSRKVLPRLLEYSVTSDQVRVMTEENPRRLLTFGAGRPQ